MGENYNLAVRYRDEHFPIEEYNLIKDKINVHCKRYILGHACLTAKKSWLDPDKDFEELSRVFNYSQSSLQKFMSYAKAIDYIESFAPEFVEKIIDDEIRLSLENILWLIKKKRSEIIQCLELMADDNVRFSDVFPYRKRRFRGTGKDKQASAHFEKKTLSIKDTPAYDPDAPVSSLSYTIPSWVGTMEKVFISVDFTKISAAARFKLRKEIVVLADAAEVLLKILKEDMK